MKRLVVVAVLVGACGPDARQQQPQSPLEAFARSALSCPTGTLTWSADGGTITAAGDFTAPPCTPPYTDTTYHVTVSGCGNTTTIPIAVSDALQSLSVYCGVISPASCCTVPPWTVPPGAQVQLYAALQYSCSGHVEYSQPPPALCP